MGETKSRRRHRRSLTDSCPLVSMSRPINVSCRLLIPYFSPCACPLASETSVDRIWLTSPMIRYPCTITCRVVWRYSRLAIAFSLSTVETIPPPWIETTQHRSVPLPCRNPNNLINHHVIQRYDPLGVKQHEPYRRPTLTYTDQPPHSYRRREFEQ